LAIQPFAVLEGTRGYPPPEKRFSRKSLGVSTVCARTPVNPADRPAAREEASGEGKGQLSLKRRCSLSQSNC
jgi:hypothetical protein